MTRANIVTLFVPPRVIIVEPGLELGVAFIDSVPIVYVTRVPSALHRMAELVYERPWNTTGPAI